MSDAPLVAFVSDDFVAVHPDGRRQPFTVRIDQPSASTDYEWWCHGRMTGPFDLAWDGSIAGGSGLQALCLALAWVRARLLRFVEEGGRLELPEPPGDRRDDGPDDDPIIDTRALVDAIFGRGVLPVG